MSAEAVQAKLPILIIEDEPSVMTFLRIALERQGYRVVQAVSAADGLKLLQEGDYRGVVSDMRTPGGVNGADVHAWLRANRPGLLSRLIFITGDFVNEETAAILRSTGSPCLEKPFRIHEFLNVVNRTIGPAQS